MSNVSDTDEIVAACLLFPLARTFLVGGRPHVTAGSIGERKLGVVGAPLSAPEMRGQAPERPETMHIGNGGQGWSAIFAPVGLSISNGAPGRARPENRQRTGSSYLAAGRRGGEWGPARPPCDRDATSRGRAPESLP
jgi:hypothetical protein